MKTLKQEAEEYFNNNIFCDGITPFEEDISKRSFIAGANSKYVQAEKIKAQIDILEGVNGDYYYSITIYEMIHKLEQQLRQLKEDETKV